LGLPWAVDNGAFSGFDPARFRRLLARITGLPGCLFLVCPDVVADARATLARWREWSPECRATGQPLAFVGQDGLEDLAPPWDEFTCYFAGGSTRWKLSTVSLDLIAEAKARDKYVHVGRVNSLKRLRWCVDAGADSVDGSGYSRFAALTRTKRPDMKLERHLRFVRQLEQEGCLFAELGKISGELLTGSTSFSKVNGRGSTANTPAS
jgi:hypothetical protein